MCSACDLYASYFASEHIRIETIMMEQQNASACIEKYVKDIAFSASYNPTHIKVAESGYLSNIKGQREYAERRLMVLKKSNQRALAITNAMQEEEWAWEIFSKLVLPMLEFVDESP